MSTRPRRGRPSKGLRRQLRLSYSAANSALLHKLCVRYNRSRDNVLATAVIVGLHHTDELAQALFCWANPDEAPPIPRDLAELRTPTRPEWVSADTDDGLVPADFNMPIVYTHLLNELCATPGILPVALRSALLWVGLNHLSEFPANLAELDDVQRGGGVSQTALAFYSGELVEGRTANDVADARLRLHRGDSPEAVAAATGIPLDFLTALRDEMTTQSNEGGQLSLAG